MSQGTHQELPFTLKKRWIKPGLAVAVVLIAGLLYWRWTYDPDAPQPSWEPLLAAANSLSEAKLETGRNVRVTKDERSQPYWECVTACDPENAEVIHTASMVMRPDGRNAIAVFVSEDGGESWTESGYWEPGPDHRLGDPTLAVGTNSTAYLVFMDVDAAEHRVGDLVFLQWSVKTRLWTEKNRHHGFVDRPWLAVNRRSAQGDKIYCLGQHPTPADVQWDEPILFSSFDGLQSLSIDLPHTGRRMKNCRPANPLVLDNGDLFVAYMDRYLKKKIKTIPRPVIYTAVGDGDCNEFAAMEPVNTRWWSDTTQSGIGGCWFPMLATDRSETCPGRIYCVWDDGEAARNQTRVFLSSSDNRGKTWSRPISLGEQPLMESTTFITTRPAIAVNRDGVVAVVWYDRRGLPPAELVPNAEQENIFNYRIEGWNVRVRLSLDGGLTWQPSTQLNTSSGTGAFFVGHTLGLSAAADGRFHATWIDNRTGENEVWHTSFAPN